MACKALHPGRGPRLHRGASKDALVAAFGRVEASWLASEKEGDPNREAQEDIRNMRVDIYVYTCTYI